MFLLLLLIVYSLFFLIVILFNLRFWGIWIVNCLILIFGLCIKKWVFIFDLVVLRWNSDWNLNLVCVCSGVFLRVMWNGVVLNWNVWKICCFKGFFDCCSLVFILMGKVLGEVFVIFLVVNVCIFKIGFWWIVIMFWCRVVFCMVMKGVLNCCFVLLSGELCWWRMMLIDLCCWIVFSSLMLIDVFLFVLFGF